MCRWLGLAGVYRSPNRACLARQGALVPIGGALSRLPQSGSPGPDTSQASEPHVLASPTDRSLVSRWVIVALVVAAAIAGCGDPPAPDKATSEAQVRQRMLEYNLMQITPGSGARLCSYMVPDAREAWKEDDSKAATVMRDLLPPSVVDCESHWDYFIGLFMRDPKVV